MSNPDLIWNVNSVEEVRAEVERVLSSQSEDLRRRAIDALELANILEERAVWLRANPYVYTRVSYWYPSSTAENREQRWRDERCSSGTAARRREAETLEELVIKLRYEARKLDEESYELDRKMRRLNEKIRSIQQELHDKDAGYAERIMDKKRGIEHYLDKIKELKNRIDPGADLHSRGDLLMHTSTLSEMWNFESIWNMAGDMLARDYADLESRHFATLAWFLAKQNTEGTEKFLNLMAEEVGTTPDTVPPRSAFALTVCVDKVNAIKAYIDAGLSFTTTSQMLLMHEGDMVGVNRLTPERHRLKQLSALLSVVSEIVGNVPPGFDEGGHVMRALIAGVGATGPFSLRDHDFNNDPTLSGGLILSVNYGSVSFEGDVTRIGPWPETGLRGNNDIIISPVIDHGRLGHDLLDLTLDGLIQNHELTFADAFMNQLIGTTQSYALSDSAKRLGNLIAAKPGANIMTGAYYILSMIAKARSDVEKSQKIIHDLRILAEAGHQTLYYFLFYIEGVVIQESGQPLVVIQHMTHQTYGAIRAFNEAYELTGSNAYTLLDFAADPLVAFDTYLVKRSNIIRFDELRGDNRSAGVTPWTPRPVERPTSPPTVEGARNDPYVNDIFM